MVTALKHGRRHLPHTPFGQATYALYVAICLFALAKGDRWQKVSGGMLLLVAILTVLVQDRIHWLDPEARLFTLDGLLLAYFLGLAVFIGRAWMMVCAAFQLLSTLSHPAAHALRHVDPNAYLALLQLFNYGVYLSVATSVAVGVLGRGRTRREAAP
jgi:hypothetical protein